MRRARTVVVAGLLSLVPCMAFAEVRNPTNGHYYRVVNTHSPEALTWSAAKAAAETYTYLGVRGHLVTITYDDEQQFVNSLITPPTPGLATFWIGGKSVGPSFTGYEWITGEAFGYTNWPTEASRFANCRRGWSFSGSASSIALSAAMSAE